MQVATPKKGYKLVKTSFDKYEEIPEEWELKKLGDMTSCEVFLKLEGSSAVRNKQVEIKVHNHN